MKKKFTFCLITIVTCLPMVFAVSSLISETRKGQRQEKECASQEVEVKTDVRCAVDRIKYEGTKLGVRREANDDL